MKIPEIKSIKLPSFKQPTKTQKIAFAFCCIALLIFICWFSIIPKLINGDAVKSELVAYMKKLTGMQLEIQGDIYTKMSPMPHLIIDKLYVRNVETGKAPFVISVKYLDIYPDLFSIFGKNIAIEKVIISQTDINLERNAKGNINWTEIIDNSKNIPTETKDSDNLDSESFKNTEFYIENSNISYINPDKNSDAKFDNISAIINQNPAQNKQELQANFRYLNKIFDFDGKFSDLGKFISDKQDSVDFNLTSDKSSLNYKGEISYNNNNIKLNGNINFGSDDIAIWIATAIGNKPENDNRGYKPLPLEIKSSISTDETGAIKLPDFTIEGESIKAKTSISYDNAKNIKVNSEIESINLENIFANGIFGKPSNIKQQETIEDEISKNNFSGYSHKFLFNSITLEGEIKIDDIFYNNKHIKDSIISLDIEKGEMSIPQALIRIPGEGKLLFSGIGKEGISGFSLEGQIDIQGNDFNEAISIFKSSGVSLPPEDFKRFHIISNANISGKEIRLSEFKAIIEKTSIIGGIIVNIDERSTIRAALNITGINLDNFVNLWGLQTWQTAFLQDNLVDKSDGSLSIWLKQLGYNLSVKASMEKYILNKKLRDKSEFKLAATSGKLEISDLKTSYNGTSLSGRAFADVSSSIPKLDLKLDIDNLDTATFFENSSAPQATAKDPQERWSKQAFDFSWIDLVNASYHLKFGHFKHNNFQIYNSEISGDIADRILTVKDINTKILGANFAGAITVRGGVIPSLEISGDLTSLSTANIASLFPIMKSLSGDYNMNMHLATNGINLFSWVSNLKGGFAINGINVEINGFNLPGIIRSVGYVRTVADILDVVRRALPGGRTLFNNITGEWNINNGIVTTSNTQLKSYLSDAALNSRIDLVNWKMQNKINFFLKELDNEHPPTMTINIFNDIDKPQIELDTRSLEQYITNRTSEKMLKDYGN